MKKQHNVFTAAMFFLLLIISFYITGEPLEKEKSNIEKIIEKAIETHDYKLFKTLLSKYEPHYFWTPIGKAKFNEYQILDMYLRVIDINTKNSLLHGLLRDVGTLYFIRLVDNGVVTDEDFSFSKNFYYSNLLCVIGRKMYFDLFREFIYKNKNPYSICQDPNNWFETELHYAIIANDIDAVKYVLDNGYIEHIGLNFEKDLGKKYFTQWVYTEEQEKEDEEKPNPYKGKIIMENFIGEPRGFPIALALRGSTFKHEQMRTGDNLPSFDIIKLLIDKGARGISKKKAFELLEKTKSNRKPEEYEKIKQYLQKNYPDDKPLKKP